MAVTDMTLGDLVSEVRDIIAEPSPVRFSQAFMGRAATTACRQLSLDIDHPYGEYIFDVGNGTREYQLPAISRILRIYMVSPNGSQQLLIPTDVPTLNGEIQETWDNTSSFNNSNPPQTPQWLVQQPEAYPIINVPQGGRVPTKNSWHPNSRPSYAMRGGYIVFSIPPMTTSPTTVVKMEYVVQHPAVSNLNDPILMPQNCKMALAWYMVSRCYMSDNLDKANEAMANYMLEKTRMNMWQENLQGSKLKGFVPITRRNRGRGGRGGGWW
jgi:hypothetical protein